MERMRGAGAAGALLVMLFFAAGSPAPDESIDPRGPSVPPYPEVRRLAAALDDLQRTADTGGWPLVPAGEPLRPGDASVRVPELRDRLLATGDLPEPGVLSADPFYGPELVAAVLHFQRRHGLADDGVVGTRTLAALNVPVERRIDQVRVNLERWRWLPADLGEHHLRVNIAGFELDEVQSGWITYSARVIVGRQYTKTPVFSSEITHLVLNPYWSVPSGIARREILPAVKKDPSYLAREGFDVLAAGGPAVPIDPATIDWSELSAARLPYVFRQRPGPGNSLGRIKFVFPNPYDVYLHDTPARSLFEREVRAFSHGCIRLQNPLELADRLLAGDPAWTPERLRAEIASGRKQSVRLPAPLPIHVVYFTAWVDGAGTLHFRNDVYGRDAAVLDALGGGGGAGGASGSGEAAWPSSGSASGP
jgi:murein L,D-transpeptidase YcbB/YkuD